MRTYMYIYKVVGTYYYENRARIFEVVGVYVSVLVCVCVGGRAFRPANATKAHSV